MALHNDVVAFDDHTVIVEMNGKRVKLPRGPKVDALYGLQRTAPSLQEMDRQALGGLTSGLEQDLTQAVQPPAASPAPLQRMDAAALGGLTSGLSDELTRATQGSVTPQPASLQRMDETALGGLTSGLAEELTRATQSSITPRPPAQPQNLQAVPGTAQIETPPPEIQIGQAQIEPTPQVQIGPAVIEDPDAWRKKLVELYLDSFLTPEQRGSNLVPREDE